MTILRDATHTLVQFAGDLPAILFDHTADGEARDVAGDADQAFAKPALTEKLSKHRMIHAENQFSQTMITTDGAVRGNH